MLCVCRVPGSFRQSGCPGRDPPAAPSAPGVRAAGGWVGTCQGRVGCSEVNPGASPPWKVLGSGAWRLRGQCRVQTPSRTSLGAESNSEEPGSGHKGFRLSPYVSGTLSTYVPSSGGQNDPNQFGRSFRSHQMLLCDKELVSNSLGTIFSPLWCVI